jgi:hypothetical protein
MPTFHGHRLVKKKKGKTRVSLFRFFCELPWQGEKRKNLSKQLRKNQGLLER